LSFQGADITTVKRPPTENWALRQHGICVRASSGDKFKSLLIRFERKDICFFGAHAIAFAMIDLHHIITGKSFN
jgi:hypothetical protein